ncbi:ketoacyl synthase domain-containing protein [Protomyces lactucae-debilis]|uniref:3-oxoacyl-[acyl-carrier-protein] synthase n=1 Tax=Protomyces lactucae-debilis TaxID=2754530 RepID=A0A1Y2FM63_PROLT|nr:ketoacyl synthase domain-containing protein [Protomyces lactucae-debilis]ORY85060.1 ketoacyl synthase domain-containing protein [Protomyces lactucae-debilis]
MKRVVVTGVGLVTPLGSGVKYAWERLIAGHSGIKSLIGHDGNDAYASLPSTVGAIVPRGTGPGEWNTDGILARGEGRSMALFTQYAVSAAHQALDDAGWRPATDLERERTGVCLGSGIGSFDDVYDTSLAFNSGGFRKVSPLFVPRLLINMAAGHLSIKYGLRGPHHSASTACTTGNHSIGDASRFIQFGDADVMLAGGAEASMHPLALAGFARAKSLATNFNDDPELASRPFDKDRCGFVMGEGSGVVVLESLDHAKARGARIYAEVSGYGLSGDAHHMTAPHEHGDGAARAMKNALRHAGLKPSQVEYVNAHATSTHLGDIAENRAIKSVLLGDGGHSHAKHINVSSCKGALGHLLGAAGAVESIFTILALHHGILPPTRNLHNIDDPEFNCNYVPNEAQRKEIKHALTNSFGFGGTNASLCFSKF